MTDATKIDAEESELKNGGLQFKPMLLAALLSVIFAAMAWTFGLPGHYLSFLGAIAVVCGFGFQKETLQKSIELFGALLAAFGGILSGIESDQMSEDLLVAVRGGDDIPYLSFHHLAGRTGVVKTNYDGQKPIFEVQFEIHRVEKKQRLIAEGKSPKEVQAAIEKIPLFPQNLIPGYPQEWPHFEFPEESVETYAIYVMTRNAIFVEYCRLMKVEKSQRLSQSCFVIEPGKERKIKKMFHDDDFPLTDKGRPLWPNSKSIEPPLAELDTIESKISEK